MIKNAIQHAKVLNIEIAIQRNVKIVLLYVQNALDQKYPNAQNANLVLYYKRQLVNLNVKANGWTKEMEFANNVLIYLIALNVLIIISIDLIKIMLLVNAVNATFNIILTQIRVHV